MSPAPGAIHKGHLRRSFDRAAPAYDRHARLQREVASRLLERVAEIRAAPSLVLDVGTGTGEWAEVLARRFRRARVLALDISPGMIEVARRRRRLRLYPAPHYLVADMEALPAASGSVDFIFSNLSFQWGTDLGRVLAELYRVARPGTPLVFTSFGPDTLAELRAAWQAADGGAHVNEFVDMHDVGDLLMGAGFTEVVMDVDRITEHYPDVRGVMTALKSIGAHNVLNRRARGLTGRGRLAAMEAAYEAHRGARGLPVTYEVVYGLGWVPSPTTVMVPSPASGRRP